jgi:hypothetical protein
MALVLLLVGLLDSAAADSIQRTSLAEDSGPASTGVPPPANELPGLQLLLRIQMVEELVKDQQLKADQDIEALKADLAAMSKKLAMTQQQLLAHKTDLKAEVVEQVEARCGLIYAAPKRPSWRNLQSQGVQSQGDIVRQHKRSLLTTPGADPAEGSGGGKRRAMQGIEQCDKSLMPQRLSAINEECCNGPMDDCSDGKLHSCSESCAALLLPMWSSCRSELGQTVTALEEAVALCPTSVTSGGMASSSTVREFMAVCPAGVIAMDCIPACGDDVYGDLLLLNLNGDDSKLTCELRNGLFSWIGASGGAACWQFIYRLPKVVIVYHLAVPHLHHFAVQSRTVCCLAHSFCGRTCLLKRGALLLDGGFMGADCATFASSINSGAAGTFTLDLMLPVAMAATVTLVSEQNIIIRGSASAGAVPILWEQTQAVPAFDLGPQSKANFAAVSFVTGTTLPVFNVEVKAHLDVEDCTFERLGGSGIVLTGGAAIVQSSTFANLCHRCFAVQIIDPASFVTMDHLKFDQPASSAVSFPIGVYSSNMVLANADHCQGLVTVLLLDDTQSLGTITVPTGQTLELQGTEFPTVDASFNVQGSVRATNMAFKHTDPSQEVFFGDGILALDDCQLVDSNGNTQPLSKSCIALAIVHGRVGGACAGDLGDICSYTGCDEGYELSVERVSRRCGAGGIWTDTAPTCRPSSCAPAAISHSDRVDHMNMCNGVTGDVCTYVCDIGYSAYGEHVCRPFLLGGVSVSDHGQFAGGSCRPENLCLDDPMWIDPDGNGCSSHDTVSADDMACPADALGLDGRAATEACPVSCGTCACVESDAGDQDPGPGGVGCDVIKNRGLCESDASVTGAADLAGVPLWTFCCSSCSGCDGVPNSDAAEDDCGVCGGDGSSCVTSCDGGAERDDCGVCGGFGLSCMFNTPCTPTAGGLLALALWIESGWSGSHTTCLAGDVTVAAGTAPDHDGYITLYNSDGSTMSSHRDPAHGDTNNSPTLTIYGPQPVDKLILDCSRNADAPCKMLDRLYIGSGWVFLHNLQFDAMVGTAIYINGEMDPSFFVQGCSFTGNADVAISDDSCSGCGLMITGSTFSSNVLPSPPFPRRPPFPSPQLGHRRMRKLTISCERPHLTYKLKAPHPESKFMSVAQSGGAFFPPIIDGKYHDMYDDAEMMAAQPICAQQFCL